ncbi:MAG: protein translocase subunit SecD [Gammaproteobacteria bacterium]|nr:MAG: protein translocase subunit SecD [Gammaproteobacteria bacterium]
MLNQYPLWKYLIIILALVIGVIYALPNLYGEDPAVQISGIRKSKVSQAMVNTIKIRLENAKLAYKNVKLESESIKVRFSDTETQLRARNIIEHQYNEGYTIALTLLPATPDWLRAFGASPMSLGLDLRGGVHFLLQVDMKPILQKAEESNAEAIRQVLRRKKIRYLSVTREKSGGLKIRFRTDDDRSNGRSLINSELSKQFDYTESKDKRSYFLYVRMNQDELSKKKNAALNQNMERLRNRVDQLGVAEPVVQQQGADRIVVQLPGIQDTAAAKRIIGRTATLEVKMVDHEHGGLTPPIGQRPPPGSKLYKTQDGRPLWLLNRTIYSGSNIIDAGPSFDSRTNQPVVSITLDSQGAASNRRVTGKNIGKNMAVILKERRQKTRKDANGRPVLDKKGRIVKDTVVVEEVITYPTINSQLSSRFQIEGRFSTQEANDLALLLRAGSLAAPVDIIEERTIGPSLGRDNIKQGFKAIVIGLIGVLIFMLVYYRLFGMIANVALVFNLVLLFAVLSMTPAVLTLPGIAGILLTVGMAVDANVLIFERIREEIRNGNTPQASIHAGYEKALSTIADANITTLIAAIMLLNFGTGPIKGFAVTLIIGILTSMFTAIFAARGLTNLLHGGRRLTRLWI